TRFSTVASCFWPLALVNWPSLMTRSSFLTCPTWSDSGGGSPGEGLGVSAARAAMPARRHPAKKRVRATFRPERVRNEERVFMRQSFSNWFSSVHPQHASGGADPAKISPLFSTILLSRFLTNLYHLKAHQILPVVSPDCE